jgi:hypothetical protein
MRNPVQEYEIARSLPIPELEKVMLGQSDTVSMAVAHAALREKMQAEVAKKGMAAAQQAQAPKVRDKDLMEARGLTSLPVDIPMTPGGITGMASGGEVQRFQAGGLGGAYTPSQFQNVGVRNPAPAASRTPSVGSFGKFASRLLGGPLGAVNLLSDPNAVNVGEEEYLEMLRRLRALGYSDDQIAAMPDEARKALASGAAVRIPEEFRTAPTTATETAQPPGQQPSVQQPPAAPQISVPSGTSGLRALMPKELTAEEAMEKARPFSSMETVAQYGAQRIEDLAKRQEEEKTAFEKTLIDNKDLFAEARKDLEEGKLSSAKEKELDIAAALLKSAATVRKQDIMSGLASLGVDVAGAEKTFNKAERERKAALMNIKRAERAEEAGNERAALDFRMRANDKMDSAQNEFVKATMNIADVDRKTALGMVQKVEEQRLGIGMEIAKLDAAAGRLAAELKLRLDESGQKKSQQQITDALELAQKDYKNLSTSEKSKVDEEQYLRQRAANYLGILKSGTFGGASTGQKEIDFTKIGR